MNVDAAIEAGCPCDLAIGCVFRDEAPYLREWIEFHRMVGVEHFILVNDRSDDDYRAALAPYLAQGVITLIERECPPSLRGRGWTEYQRAVLDGLCREAAGKIRWLALIDVDEFLVPADDADLVRLLARYEDYGAVHVRWEPFGTSYLPRLDPERLLIEQLRLKARFRPDREMLGKSIVKPHRVSGANIHMSQLGGDYRCHHIDPGLQPGPPLKLHHYWSRDERYLFEIKLPRSAAIKGWRVEDCAGDYFRTLFNEVPDASMARYFAPLRRRLDAMR